MKFAVGSVIRQKYDKCPEAEQVCYIQRKRSTDNHREASQVGVHALP